MKLVLWEKWPVYEERQYKVIKLNDSIRTHVGVITEKIKKINSGYARDFAIPAVVSGQSSIRLVVVPIDAARFTRSTVELHFFWNNWKKN